MKSHEQVMLRQFVLRNDADAFGALSNQYASLVYGVCWRILRDEHKAADAAQETFLQLLRHAHKIHGSVAAWLHRVATGKAIDIMRKDKRQREHTQTFQAGLDDTQEDWAQLSIHIDEALNLLDAQSRDIIIEHYLENRSTREIARRKGLSQATVSRKANAALQSLRQKLRVPGLVVTPAVMSSMFAENSAQAVPVAVVQAVGKMAVAGHQASLGLIAKASYVVRGFNLLPKVALTAALVTIVALPLINRLSGDQVDPRNQELLSLIDAYRVQIRDIDFSYSFVTHILASDPGNEGITPGMDLRIKIKDRMRYTAQGSRHSNFHVSSYDGEVTYKYHKDPGSGPIHPERTSGTTMHNYIYAAMMWPTIKLPREVGWLDIKVLLRSDETKVLLDTEELFGTSTVVLEYYSGNIKVWLDIEHGGIVRKAELRREPEAGAILSQRFQIPELYNIESIYFPAKATWEIFASSDAPEEMHNTPIRRTTMEVSQDDLRINSGLTEKDFVIDFPPGTRVFDRVSGENYTK